METNTIPSPASSITKLGIVRFSVPEVRPDEDAQHAIVELPSFSSEERSRPTVQMPPLADHREVPESIDDAFDTDFEDELPPAPPVRERVATLLGMVPLPVPPRGSSPGLSVPPVEEAAPAREAAPAPSGEPPAAADPADRSARRPASSWWHGALISAAM